MSLLSQTKLYSTQAKMMLEDVIIYRADVISRLISWTSRFLNSAFLWIAILNSNENGVVGGYDLQEALTYFLLMQVVTGFVFTSSGFRFADDIQSGNLSGRLVQPLYYPLLVISTELGRTFFYFITNSIICVAIYLLFRDYFSFHLSGGFLVLGILSMILAFLMNFALNSMIGMLAFWISSSRRLIYHFFAIITLLSGVLIPLEFFPDKLEYALRLSPFPYIFYFPVHMVQSLEWNAELRLGLALQAGYTVLLIGLMALQYHFGLKKYEAVGR